jgi:hypothetical protein
MTDEKINAAIAEACGRRRNPNGEWYPDNGLKVGTQGIANYCNDLNAMHEAENGLNKNLRNQYIDWLGTIYTDSWEFATATARQRAEAFLRVLGKWEVAK